MRVIGEACSYSVYSFNKTVLILTSSATQFWHILDFRTFSYLHLAMTIFHLDCSSMLNFSTTFLYIYIYMCEGTGHTIASTGSSVIYFHMSSRRVTPQMLYYCQKTTKYFLQIIKISSPGRHFVTFRRR